MAPTVDASAPDLPDPCPARVPRRVRPWVRGGVLAGALVLGAGAALAQDEAIDTDAAATDALNAAIMARAPHVRTVAFVDRDPDASCDPVEAQYGRCVEEVDFAPMQPAWGRDDTALTDEQRALMRSMSRLYADTWEDLALRRDAKEDIVGEWFEGAGVSYLPIASATWDSTVRKDKRIYALPEADTWLPQDRWVQTQAKPVVKPFFPAVRYAHPSGVYTPPDVVKLKGRFVRRLAYDGKLHDYDIMDGDSSSSGPFFEQMYPYDTALEAEGDTLVPLTNFILPEQLKDPKVTPERVESLRREVYAPVTFDPDAGYDTVKELASDEFRSFYHLVGLQIVRFGLEEYTPTHLRVLTSLIAMHTPPSALEGGLAARDVVAASEGQTDSDELVNNLVDPSRYALGTAFELNYAALPPSLVSDYVERFPEWQRPPMDFLEALNEELWLVLQEYMRPETQALVKTDDASLETWVQTYAMPGRAPDVEQHLKRIALAILVQRLPEVQRDEIETRMLLDHIDLEVSGRFVTDRGFFATPQAQEDQSAGQWRAVLGMHGYSPQPIPDGPGAVDPLAICTTKERREALTEPAFGAIDFDLIVVAEDGLSAPEDVLAQSSHSVPFVMVDDPKITRPTVARLVGLPQDRAVYRVRWHIWAGWHFLWSTEQLGAEDEAKRLVLRTTAVCADTVLAPPELVPTLARAALLDGRFIPTTPAGNIGSRKDRKEIEERETLRAQGMLTGGPTSEEALESGTVAAAEGDYVVDEAQAGQVRIEEDASSATDQLAGRGARIGDLFGEKELTYAATVVKAPGPVRYLQDLIRAPLYDIAAEEPMLMLVAFDATTDDEWVRAWHWRPRAPYARTHERFGRKLHLRTATWTTALAETEGEEYSELFSPAYRETDSVTSGSIVPKWRRRTDMDFTLGAGIGAFPYRRVYYSCNGGTESLVTSDPSTVVACEPGDPAGFTQTEGIGLDLNSMFTWWALDTPRLALEFGPAVELDLLPGGKPVLGSDDVYNEPSYSWAFAPRFGFLAGVRGAPRPHPLHPWGNRAYPWGADRPDGSSKLNRDAWGLRAGFLLGPGFNGLEATVNTELWGAWSVRRRLSPHATYTPYHPRMVIGPYMRGGYGIVLITSDDSADARYYDMDKRYQLTVGVRGQFRLGGKVAIPEG